MSNKKETFNMRLSEQEDKELKHNAKFVYGKNNCTSKYIVSLIGKDSKRISRVKNKINAKIQRFIDWLPVSTIDKSYTNYEDCFEVKDEDNGFQIRAYFYSSFLDGFDFLINEKVYELTDEQFYKIFGKIQ